VSYLAGCAPASRRFELWASIFAVVALVLGCQEGPGTFLTRLDEARRLAADVRVQFNKADDASNRAVMADTDEASISFAHEAENAVQIVEKDVTALAPLLRNVGVLNETQFLEEFRKHFAEYRNLDKSILELAVENTNLKAQRLSFGPVRQAADSFRDSLGTAASSVAPKDRCRVEALVAKAMLAVREIQVLQAPHIAEPDDAAMTRMEKEMADLEASARGAVKELGELAPPGAHPALGAALSALDRFRDISGELLTLSRRNTNVRSLDLSLRTKPTVVAACDDSLHALQDALSKEGSKATK
jgi:hypothetical protein